jgi:Reverse transcriptase (RNA-dependent DNA polymerase)
VYLDDIVLTGNDPVEMKRFKTSLVKEFEIKDLGELRYFLDIEVGRSKKGIVLSQ